MVGGLNLFLKDSSLADPVFYSELWYTAAQEVWQEVGLLQSFLSQRVSLCCLPEETRGEK